MDFLEKDLETILYESEMEVIQNRGLRGFKYNSIFRQVYLGNYGIADIVTYRKVTKGYNIITVYELKNKLLNSSSFWQILKYIKGIKHFLDLSGFDMSTFKVDGVLIGREVDVIGEFSYLPTIHSDVLIYTYDYKVDGIKFSHLDDAYNLINPGNISPASFGCASTYQFLKKLVNG